MLVLSSITLSVFGPEGVDDRNRQEAII